MPTLQKLADNGLMYSQWHTTALCSPTRSTFLTGRNHHLNGCSCITEGAQGFPGGAAALPAECATIGQVLQDNGFSTFWLGKNHNVPEEDIAAGASRSEWPLQKGFDRFYGFLGGETNKWYPDLVEDNQFIDQPYSPRRAITFRRTSPTRRSRMIRDQKASNPVEAVVHVVLPRRQPRAASRPKEYIDKYKGKFDDGYEAYREWVLPRMIAKGILPKDTKLTPINPMPNDIANPGDAVRPWDTLSADEKKLFARMAEVYAGFSEYTDAQIGRLIDYLEQTGQLDNTLIFYCADNGASGEGSPNGSVNENKFFNGYPDELSENLKYLDVLGGPDTYEPLSDRVGRRLLDAVPDVQALLAICRRHVRPAGDLLAEGHQGERRGPPPVSPFDRHRADDPRCVRPGDAEGLSRRRAVAARRRVDALHVRRKPDAPTEKKRQYYAMLGTRGIWENGWKAVALHAPLTGKGHFDKDEWELYHVDEDRSESNNLAEQASGQAQGADQGVVRGSREELGAAAGRSDARSRCSASSGRAEERARALHLLSGHVAGAGRRRRQHPRPLVQDHRRRGDHRTGLLRRDLRPRLALRRPRAVHQGQEAALRLQLPRHQAGAEVRLATSSSRANTRSAWSSSARRPASTASRSARRSSTSTTRSSPQGDDGTQPGKFTLAATVSASATTAAMR